MTTQPMLRRLWRHWSGEILFLACLALVVLALAACEAGDAMPHVTGTGPVVTGDVLPPMGAIDLCNRHPEELRCLPTDD